MAPHAFRHRFCTDTEPIGGGGGGRAGRLPRLARFSPCWCVARALSRRCRRGSWLARGQILLFKIRTTNSEMARRARLFR
jgi:hypothetical protein